MSFVDSLLSFPDFFSFLLVMTFLPCLNHGLQGQHFLYYLDVRACSFTSPVISPSAHLCRIPSSRIEVLGFHLASDSRCIKCIGLHLCITICVYGLDSPTYHLSGSQAIDDAPILTQVGVGFNFNPATTLFTETLYMI